MGKIKSNKREGGTPAPRTLSNLDDDIARLLAEKGKMWGFDFVNNKPLPHSKPSFNWLPVPNLPVPKLPLPNLPVPASTSFCRQGGESAAPTPPAEGASSSSSPR